MTVIFCHFKALEGFFLPLSFVVFTVETMLNVALLHCRLYCRDNCCNIEKSSGDQDICGHLPMKAFKNNKY